VIKENWYYIFTHTYKSGLFPFEIGSPDWSLYPAYLLISPSLF